MSNQGHAYHLLETAKRHKRNEHVRKLVRSGMSHRQVARATGLCKSSITYIMR